MRRCFSSASSADSNACAAWRCCAPVAAALQTLYNSMLENNCSEQSSRMSAMENSTKNAGEMLGKVGVVGGQACAAERALAAAWLAAATAGSHVAGTLAADLPLAPCASLLAPLQLTLTYNRTRQASITTELIEIISGEKKKKNEGGWSGNSIFFFLFSARLLITLPTSLFSSSLFFPFCRCHRPGGLKNRLKKRRTPQQAKTTAAAAAASGRVGAAALPVQGAKRWQGGRFSWVAFFACL